MSETKPLDLPVIARYKPYYYELEGGKSYLWCACGLSKNQPFCDNSHRGTNIRPVRYRAEQDEDVLFCGCKRTADAPFCEGAHNNLKDVYDTDDPDSPENQVIPEVGTGDDGRAVLNGGCFVASLDKLAQHQQNNLSWSAVITSEQGAQFQSMFMLESSPGDSPVIHFGDRDVILLVSSGHGHINIASQEFEIGPETGIYVRPGEQFQINATGQDSLVLLAAVCPLAQAPGFSAEMTTNFDHDLPQRTIGIDPANRQSMADRFFQMLVDKNMGSKVVTQFIGDIPPSKAAPHRHLYEESIVVLRGQGYMWTQDKKTRVNAGDVIFLPRKQLHSLECTGSESMMVAGVIYPGDNPSINY
jgi:mannose-6-phosphate isomerase-like protein (cupin superfamily)/CDGSH-type Zn-finger protein